MEEEVEEERKRKEKRYALERYVRSVKRDV